jgi:hypothetical protein
MFMLDINSVFRAAPDSETIFMGFARFLGVDSNNMACLIRLDVAPFKAPFKVPLSSLISEIEVGRILDNQEFDCAQPATIDQLSAASRKKQEEAVAFLAKLLEKGRERLLFDPEQRGIVFTECANERGVSVRTPRRLYYQYLWGGQTELALSPKFQQKGAPGVAQKIGSARRGRKPNEDDESPASKVSLPLVRKELEKGARLFYLPGTRTFRKAFKMTLERYFSKGGRLLKGTDGNKPKFVETLLPAEQLPTKGQFRYVCDLLELKNGKRTMLPGRIRPRKIDMILVGRARDGVRGPGHRFEIDATKLQIKLVSRYGREKIVGNPTLYIIIDVWSGAYVGYALSLRNASWALAARALHNCFTPKGEVFRKLGLDYDDEDWFCHHLPSSLTADRAELISNKAGNVPDIGITVEVMPSMRPDRKGKVESAIKDIKHRRSRQLPGEYTKNHQRREPDGNSTAALNCVELEGIIVDSIMGFNNEPVPLAHIPPEMLADADADVTHIELYKWGLKHFPGFTRTMEPKMVYTNLMTCGTASLTGQGIYFKGQTYKSPRLTSAGYSTQNGRDKIEIRYDEHIAAEVWFFDKANNGWAPAENDNADVRRLKATFYELESFRQDAERRREKAKMEKLHQDDERDQKHALKIKNAEVETKAAKRGRSKTQNKEKIRQHKAVDILAEDLLDTGRAQASCITALVTMQNTKKSLELPDKAQDGNPASATKESIAQRSKYLWRSHVNLDK